MWHSLKNIWRLGVKELWSLWRDPVMLVLIVYTFTASVYTAATAMPDTLHKAPIAIVDHLAPHSLRGQPGWSGAERASASAGCMDHRECGGFPSAK